jgi:hypothetical protein
VLGSLALAMSKVRATNVRGAAHQIAPLINEPVYLRARNQRRQPLVVNGWAGDVIDYIEMFYNSKRRHGFNNLLSPLEYEKRLTERLVSV